MEAQNDPMVRASRRNLIRYLLGLVPNEATGRGWTALDIAQLLGVSQSDVTRVMEGSRRNGERAYSVRDEICRITRKSTEELFGLTANQHEGLRRRNVRTE